jgi:hypothetical protein
MSTHRDSNSEVNTKQCTGTRSVRIDFYDRRQEDLCGCKGHCWLAKNSPSLLKKYNSEQVLKVVKCRQLCQMQRSVLEVEAA